MQTYTKAVQLNRLDRDFSAIVNGQVISIHPTHQAAQAACDAYVMDCLTHPHSEVISDAPAAVATSDAPAAAVIAPTRAAVAAIVATSRAKAATSQRWLNALNRAYSELETGAWAYNGRVLVVRSRTSRKQYKATANECQCTAYAKGSPCWHRAAARLIAVAAQHAA